MLNTAFKFSAVYFMYIVIFLLVLLPGIGKIEHAQKVQRTTMVRVPLDKKVDCVWIL